MISEHELVIGTLDDFFFCVWEEQIKNKVF